MRSLVEQFHDLPLPSASCREGESFSAMALAKWPEHRVAKDTKGNACILIAGLADAAPQTVHLKHIDVRHQLRCSVHRLNQQTSAPEDGLFSIIRCTAPNIHLQQHFLQMAETVVKIIGKNPTPARVASGILTLANLFESTNRPARRELQGIWSELFVIEQAGNPEVLVESWHPDPTNLFDFTMDRDRLEVKSTSSARRVHAFSLEQLYPPGGVRLVVASLRAQRVSNGISTAQLLDRISKRLLSPSLQLQLHAAFHAIVGHHLEEALDAHFDYELARESLAFFQAPAIPKLPNDTPAGVSDIRFKSDLTNCPRMSSEEAQKLGRLFGACVRQNADNDCKTTS